MTVLDHIHDFSARYGRQITVGAHTWCYYRLGVGSPVLWLTGGLRRAALGYAFMQRLAAHHTVIAPDYPPVGTIDEYMEAFDAILCAEDVESFAVAGQSYGGMLAQAYLARQPEAVDRLILSSTGPADYGRGWLPVEYLIIALVRLLPEATTKRFLAGRLLKFMTVPDPERLDWEQAMAHVMAAELTRADVVSHFAVAADLVRKGLVNRSAYRAWNGRVIVLSAANDPTQSRTDFPRYEKLFGRPVRVLDMGQMGHTAALFDPDRYTEFFEQALS